MTSIVDRFNKFLNERRETPSQLPATIIACVLGSAVLSLVVGFPAIGPHTILATLSGIGICYAMASDSARMKFKASK